MHDRDIGPHKTQFRRDENYGKKLICYMLLSPVCTNFIVSFTTFCNLPLNVF